MIKSSVPKNALSIGEWFVMFAEESVDMMLNEVIRKTSKRGLFV
jgi:hypothetical protein